MKKITYILAIILFLLGNSAQAQKGNKGGGNKHDGGNKNKNEKIDLKIKNDNVKIKVKSNGNNEKVKMDLNGNQKGNSHDNGWHHGQHKHEKAYGTQTILWFYGPGDIYECKGKGRKEKIIVFDQICGRLTTNIGFMFGLLGDLRIKLDAKKAKIKPERFDKLKIEIDLLDKELKLIEIKKNKIKVRLKKLKEEKGD